jgi:hypothetical protein
VSGFQGKGRREFTRATATNRAWPYALQAAKASITVFGISGENIKGLRR